MNTIQSEQRDEERDRYTAALAITQLCKGFHKDYVLPTTSTDNATHNTFIDEPVAKPIANNVSGHPSIANSFPLKESDREMSSPPLDLTLKNHLSCEGNKADDKFNEDKIACLVKIDTKYSLMQNPCSAIFDNCPNSFPESLLPKGFSIIKSPNFPYFIQHKDVSKTACTYTNLSPVMAENVISQKSDVFNKLWSSESPTQCWNKKKKMTFGNFTQNLEVTQESSNTFSPSVAKKFMKYPPTGLSSLAKYYRKRSDSKVFKAGSDVHENHLARCKAYGIGTKTLSPPSGLLSIQEYYQNCKRIDQNFSNLMKKGSSLEDEKYLKSKFVSVPENYESLESNTRTIPVPLCITEDNGFDTNRDLTQSHVTKVFEDHKPQSQWLHKTVSLEGKKPPQNISTHETNHSSTSTNISERDSVPNIPLNVLEVDANDIHKTPATFRSNVISLLNHGVKRPSPDRSSKRTYEGSKIPTDEYHILRPDDDGDYTLHVAVSQGDLGVVKHLVPLVTKLGGDINCRDAIRQTPLHIAVEMGLNDILQCLLEADTNPCLPDSSGRTCLHLAVLYNNIYALKQILQCPKRSEFDYDIKDYEGLTALHLAVMKGRTEASHLLIKSGLVNINLREGKSGKTALYMSAEYNQPSILSLLLEEGASNKEPDYSGYTPYQVASVKQNQEITRIIEECQKRDKSKLSHCCGKDNKKLKLQCYMVAYDNLQFK